MDIDTYIDKFKQLLYENYSDGKVPNSLTKEIDLTIKKNLASKKKTNHETVVLSRPNGAKCDIDCGIAELVGYLWACGINTENSCEDNVPTNYVWISFSTEEDITKFLNVLFVGIDRSNDIYERACLAYPYAKNAWLYDKCLNDDSDDLNYNSDTDSNSYSLTVKYIYLTTSVRFPNCDYDWITKRFKQYLKIVI
jgi:hypothetical protein